MSAVVREVVLDAEIGRCWPVMVQLRPHVAEAAFVPRVRAMMRGGYRLAILEESGAVRAVAGFRLDDKLVRGRHIYVDDLVTDDAARSAGHGAALLRWIEELARREGCTHVELDSGMQRQRAHRFYFREGYFAHAFHFVKALGLVLLVGAAALPAQQVPDSAFAPPIARPAFTAGQGPVVAVDAGHHNFHTVDGRYYPFAQLLRRDGYTVRGIDGPFTAEALRGVDVLVVANALHERNVTEWRLPILSAFTPEEIAAVRQWVARGGSLLLIADHMPFGGAAADLAAGFDFRFTNSFAVASRDTQMQALPSFTRAAGTLRSHLVTDGDDQVERIDSVRSFMGQAFTGPEDAVPLLVLPPGSVSLLPQQAWQFDSATVRADASGMLQGALRVVGRGRVAMFGEAAMFSAQLAGPRRSPMGMNAPEAPQNAAFVRAVLRWLSAGHCD